MLYSYIVLCISLIFSLSEPLYIWKWMQAWSPCSDIYLLNGIKSGSCSGYPWDNNATPEQDQGTLCVIVSTVISLILMRCIACGLRSARLRHMSSLTCLYRCHLRDPLCRQMGYHPGLRHRAHPLPQPHRHWGFRDPWTSWPAPAIISD